MATTASPQRSARATLWPAVAVSAGVLAVIAGSLFAKFVIGGYWLGAPLAPLYLYPVPRVSALAWAAAAVFAAAVALVPRLLDRRVGAGAFTALALVLGLVLRLSLGLAREGPSGWLSALGRPPDAQNEYLPALPALARGWGPFLDRFAEVAPSLPTHPSAHGPGLLLTIDALGIRTAAPMAAFEILSGALAVPLVYVLARRVLDDPRSRVATLLFAFSPAIMLYGVTSSDALFVTLGLLAAVGLLARRALVRVAGAAALALASLFSYSLLAVGAWAALVVLRLEGLGRAIALAASCALALAGLYAGLWALTGFDLPGTLASADLVYRVGPYLARPYAYWVLGSPAAWLFVVGLPITWYAARALGAGNSAALALAAVVAIASIGGYTKSETERIWMFLVPFACLAAAATLPRRRLVPVLVMLSLQAFAIELLTDTRY